jgi:hypothetical protein
MPLAAHPQSSPNRALAITVVMVGMTGEGAAILLAASQSVDPTKSYSNRK